MAREGDLIKIGFSFPLGGSSSCDVLEFLGGGGQGEVYKVKMDGNEYALKWYFQRQQTSDLKKSLNDLVVKGAPSAAFLWPKRVIEYKGSFGYIMDLRPPHYKNSQGLLSRKINLDYKKICFAALQIVDAFYQLHRNGLAYQDVSFGNIFLNPKDGGVLICDNDNVAAHLTSVAGITGTMGFMAPEVVLGKHMPDQYSDAFSMAILLFRMMFLEHPFDGSRWANEECPSDEFRKKIYGENPIFIFDRNNDTNRPDPNLQSNAKKFSRLYPSYIKDVFHKVFTDGILDREHGRPSQNPEADWIEALRRMRSSIFACASCGELMLYDEAKKGELICFRCKTKANPPVRLVIKIGKRERSLALFPDTKILYYQLQKSTVYGLKEGDAIMGEMAQNPKSPGKWGIRNLTKDNWFFSNKGEEEKTCEPGKAIALKAGLNIRFGAAVGEILT